jgi:hypothetical protein
VTELTSVRLSGSSGSTGEPFAIPGGSVPVSVVRLHAEESRAFSLLVTFPAGWDRPVTGHYLCDEDVVFLSGRFRIGDDVFVGGDWAHMATGYIRAGMRSETETVALARFSGPARWVVGTSPCAPLLMRRSLSEVPGAMSSPLGAGRAALLRAGEPDSSWLILEPPSAGDPSPIAAQIVDLNEGTWYHVPAGSPLPELHGHAFCWTFDA